MNTREQYLRKAVVNLQERLGLGLMLLERVMDTAAAFAFDCGRMGLEGAGQQHIEALEGVPAEPGVAE